VTRATLASIAIVAFFGLVVLPRATMPMADGDAWWHIHAGEAVMASGTVPDTNTWTIAGEGERWISQDWLSNVVMAALFNTGEWGVAWLSLLFGAIVVSAFILLWRGIGERGDTGWLGRLLWLTAGLIVAGPIAGVRVQTVDLLMTAATVLVLWSYLRRPRPITAFLLVPVAIAWVNLHAGWVMLFLIGGAVVVGELVDRWTGRQTDGPTLSLPAIGWLAGALVGSAVALVMNPNGVAMYAYPFATASIAAHRDFLTEWSPPDPTSFEGQAAIAFLLLAVLPTLAFAWRRMRAADILWLVGLSVLTLGAVRFALFLGPMGAAIAAVHLTPMAARTRLGLAVTPLLERWSRAPRSRGLARLNVALVIAVMVLGIGLSVARAAPATQAPEIAAAVPNAAAAWVEEHAPQARVFNTYSWGGYLARRLPEAKAYIDGRSDIYGDGPIRRFAETWNVTADPSTLLDEAAIDLVLIRPSAPLAPWLDEQPTWRRAYDDGQAAIWVRENGG
jgi:hypothetical protein